MIRWRWLWFSISFALLVLAYPASGRLNLDRSLQKMFAPNDPARLDFELLQKQFGVSDLVLFTYRDKKLWGADGSGFDRLRQIREEIEAIDGVAVAMDLSKIDRMLTQLDAPFGFLNGSKNGSRNHPLLDDQNKIAMRFKSIFEGQTHSRSGELVAIACMLKSENDTPGIQSRTIRQLRELSNALTKKFGVPSGMLVGQPVMVEEGFEEIERDGIRLSHFSTISLSLLIVVGFRSVRWALITIAVVQWSLIVTRGTLVWLAWDLTMVSSMLSSIVTVIGVATTMHWMLGYRQAMSDGLGAKDALAISMKQLWKPIFWACVTDAIGFASLIFANVGPVQDYGSMMAIASLIVMIGIFSLIPALALVEILPSKLSIWIGLSRSLHNVPGDALAQRILEGFKRYSLRYPRTIVVASLGLGVFAIIGSLGLQVETDFIQNFRKDAPLVTAYQAVERELGGAGVWDVIVPAPKVMSVEYLDQVLSLERSLLEIEVPGEPPLRLTKVMSFADADEAVRSSSMLGRLSIEARLLGMRQMMGDFVDSLITKPNQGQRYMRIMLRSREQSETVQKEMLIERVQQTVDAAVRSDSWQSYFSGAPGQTVSGYYVLLSKLVSSVVADQWRCFAIATLGVWIAMSIALRNAWLAVLTILPNALPSLCIMGFMGWVNMRVNLGAAMIAAVSMGLSVDSSLHYLLRYQRERKAGLEFGAAVDAAQSEIGMAMLLSTIALVLGFGSLGLSDFLPTVVFGTTAAISMVGGLLGNLTILPALLSMTYLTRNASE